MEENPGRFGSNTKSVSSKENSFNNSLEGGSVLEEDFLQL